MTARGQISGAARILSSPPSTHTLSHHTHPPALHKLGSLPVAVTTACTSLFPQALFRTCPELLRSIIPASARFPGFPRPPNQVYPCHFPVFPEHFLGLVSFHAFRRSSPHRLAPAFWQPFGLFSRHFPCFYRPETTKNGPVPRALRFPLSAPALRCQSLQALL